ncbi:hypothetical protein Gotur_003317 [Gossypium turneri]
MLSCSFRWGQSSLLKHGCKVSIFGFAGHAFRRSSLVCDIFGALQLRPRKWSFLSISDQEGSASSNVITNDADSNLVTDIGTASTSSSEEFSDKLRHIMDINSLMQDLRGRNDSATLREDSDAAKKKQKVVEKS